MFSYTVTSRFGLFFLEYLIVHPLDNKLDLTKKIFSYTVTSRFSLSFLEYLIVHPLDNKLKY